ncbi:MAG: efflux RND transporter permease subunit [Planctomycetes bacterium]|nr:efflux RND transporter permease subunit [Planctomycetota bacterium]
MNPISIALRRPITVLVLVVGTAFAGALAYTRMKVDIFPALNLPVIYVAQPYGGMDPQQMEGLIANYYEYHFLYINGIHHVESKNVQGASLMKLYFHPGTDMAQAMAETVGYVNRSRAFMPPGTVQPFIMRFDTGSVPVGYLVLSSETKTVGQIQDQALFKVRPMFAAIEGVSAPPPFGGSQRTVVVRADPQQLLARGISADEVVEALSSGNTIAPSGQLRDQTRMPLVPTNSLVVKPDELGKIQVTPGVFLRDVCRRDPVTGRPLIDDATDMPTGYALVNGKRAVYILVTKRASASTLDVVSNVRANLPAMQAVLPDDIKVSFEFDQSPYVTNSMQGVALEGLIAAGLVGLMVLLFLRDWRSVIVVVLNIPLALIAALVALWLTGQTINLMTLGGLALAVGILVDEATVEVENIHTQMAKHDSVALAVRLGNMETAVPRLLAMLCILAVFIPSFLMQGTARALFVPLSLAVGFSMIASYILSSSFLPVMCVWLLRRKDEGARMKDEKSRAGLLSFLFLQPSAFILRLRWIAVPIYVVVASGVAFLGSQQLGTEIFPQVDAGQFQFRLKAPTGTRIEQTEAITQEALRFIGDEVRASGGEINISLGYVGLIPSTYPINAVYLWMGGPEESVVRVALKPSKVRIEDLKARLREKLPPHLRSWTAEKWKREGLSADVVDRRVADLRLSFEPADIVNEVMSFGSPSPIEVAVSGPKMPDNRAHAEKVYRELANLSAVVDLRYGQALDYPTIEVEVDREKIAPTGATPNDAAKALVPFTSSSRFTVPNYWRDPASGIGYQVQVEVPFTLVKSAKDLELAPVLSKGPNKLLVRDIGRIKEGVMSGEIDRYNMRRVVSMTGNIQGTDLGDVARQVSKAVEAAGPPPQGVNVDVRGQLTPLNELFRGLGFGLIVAVVVIALMLLAYFQSFRLALVAVASVPAVLAGVVVMLLATSTTLNLQSFMGAITAVGVATANAILLVTFAERARVGGMTAREAGIEGAKTRVRPILMTSCAMIAGMLPMALGLGEGGDQVAPLGRAVIGGLAAGTLTTLFILPAVFALVMGRSGTASASLDPFDPASPHFVPHADPHNREVSHAS